MLFCKITHREPEVRKAARDALVQLGDTNAIPGLEQAVRLVEDPREKLALMEAIDYLKLPDATAGLTRTLTSTIDSAAQAVKAEEGDAEESEFSLAGTGVGDRLSHRPGRRPARRSRQPGYQRLSPILSLTHQRQILATAVNLATADMIRALWGRTKSARAHVGGSEGGSSAKIPSGQCSIHVHEPFEVSSCPWTVL